MDFIISRKDESKYNEGLRGYFQYRDLGINLATDGDYGANVIKAIPGEHAKGEWHLHHLKFQMVYILKGWVKFEYKGKGVFTFNEGDSVLQPPQIHHRELEHSDDLELIEITHPASFETEILK